MTKSRLREISWLNVLFCILVVLIHSESAAVVALDKTQWPYWLVSGTQTLAFVSVYGFFFLSGLKQFLGTPTRKAISWGRFYGKRSLSILLPYLIAVTVSWLYYVHWGYYPFHLPDLFQNFLVSQVGGHFYFMVALIQFILLMPLWRSIVRHWSPVIILPFAGLITWLSTGYLGQIAELVTGNSFPYGDRVFTTYLLFYLAGCYAGEHYEDFCALARQHFSLMGVMTLLFGGGGVILKLLNAMGRTNATCVGLLHTIYLMSGILFLFGLALQLTETLRGREGMLFKAVEKVDGVSYLVYLYHCLVIDLCDRGMDALGIPGVGVQMVVRFVFVAVVTIGASLLWRRLTKLLKRT